MFGKYLLILSFLVSPLLLANNSAPSDSTQHEFVGVKTCGMCHKSEKQGKQLSIWENSKHSKAYKTLQTKEADEIAKKQGFDTPAAKTEKCLSCHVSGNNVDKKYIGAKFNMEDGVQCETCHGAGGDYKSLKIMKDVKLAVENGLHVYDNPKDLCVKCHNENSPTHKGEYNFEEMWGKIKHPVPSK